ncbi:aromatic acid exporter family protein [Streptomyces hebeiensis]|uniref:Aromatic acid exporter family protein n=1 Tax=Streptomyces hebeiensis TaxID=229486 RepID=A0ABP4FKB0_9ACTN
MAGRRPWASLWWWLSWEVSAVGRSSAAALRAPGPERDTMVQALKAAGAAVAAWALTGWWLAAPLALMAPWTALVLIDATVYRSLRAGMQQLAVIVAGTLWASAAMAMTDGDTLGAMLIALPVMALAGTYRRLGAQGIYGATTALFVITYGAYSPSEIGHRLLETLIGATIGVCVNAFVLPPVHLRDVREQLRRLARDSAGLLRAMADGLRAEWDASDAAGWHDRARRLDQVLRALTEARGWSAESARFNPGLRLRRRPLPQPPPAEADALWDGVVGHLTALTRTLAGTAGERAGLTAPDAAFLARFADLAEEMAGLCDAEEEALAAASVRPGGAQRDDASAGERAWSLYEELAAGFRAQTGATARVSGGLLLEAEQLLSRLGPRREEPEPDG